VTFSIANAQAVQACDAIVDACDLGTTNPSATLVIYSGTPPATVDTSLSGNTVLAQLAMSNPAFGNAVDAAPNATATANTISDDTSADATGTASFFRILDRNNTPRIQGAAGVSGAELILNSVSFEAGALVEVVSLTVTMPEA
jgi:hypothetical protein